jgi:hypothetical protein
MSSEREIKRMMDYINLLEELLRESGHEPKADDPNAENYGCTICERWADGIEQYWAPAMASDSGDEANG